MVKPNVFIIDPSDTKDSEKSLEAGLVEVPLETPKDHDELEKKTKDAVGQTGFFATTPRWLKITIALSLAGLVIITLGALSQHMIIARRSQGQGTIGHQIHNFFDGIFGEHKSPSHGEHFHLGHGSPAQSANDPVDDHHTRHHKENHDQTPSDHAHNANVPRQKNRGAASRNKTPNRYPAPSTQTHGPEQAKHNATVNYAMHPIPHHGVKGHHVPHVSHHHGHGQPNGVNSTEDQGDHPASPEGDQDATQQGPHPHHSHVHQGAVHEQLEGGNTTMHHKEHLAASHALHVPHTRRHHAHHGAGHNHLDGGSSPMQHGNHLAAPHSHHYATHRGPHTNHNHVHHRAGHDILEGTNSTLHNGAFNGNQTHSLQ